jgi:hypothetical protein
VKAHFIDPMLLLRSANVPNGPGCVRELKFVGYRALAYKHSGRVYLRSRNNKDFAGRYAGITDAPQLLPDETVIDGEIGALDQWCVVGYVQPGRKRASLIGVGVSELHINHLPGVARRCQERALYGGVDRWSRFLCPGRGFR